MSESKLRIDAGEPLHKKVDSAWAALLHADEVAEPGVDPEIMVRGNELVRMTERGELEQIPTESLRERISEVAQFERETKQGTQPIDPPKDVAQVLVARDSSKYPGAPRVDRVVDVPVLTPEGAMLTTPGHQPTSKLFYRPTEKLRGVQPLPVDTTEDVEWAVQFLLGDFLHDFGFSDESSRAHALGLLLLPFVREFITGSTPLHVVLAPDYGSGKTWLAQAALYPGCGLVPATPQTKSEEEWRKRITSTLMAGASAVLLDNLSGSLDSASLASALTTGVWRDRILGESREVTLPVRNAWAATGNNLDLAPEQVRRAVPIFLDPGKTRPADRKREDFRHPDLLGWAEDNRRELVCAALTLVKHWLDGPVEDTEGGYLFVRGEGGPRGGHRTLGSFERWAHVIGGILEAAGVEGFLENRDRLVFEASEEAGDAEEFLMALYGELHTPLRLRELTELCQMGGPLQPYLPPELATAGNKLQGMLGAWLRDHNRRRVGDFQLLKTHERRARWHVYGPRHREVEDGQATA
jgi:putative DNA primase/helicase